MRAGRGGNKANKVTVRLSLNFILFYFILFFYSQIHAAPAGPTTWQVMLPIWALEDRPEVYRNEEFMNSLTTQTAIALGDSTVPVFRGAAEEGRQGRGDIPEGSASPHQTLRCGSGQPSRSHPPSKVIYLIFFYRYRLSLLSEQTYADFEYDI